MARFVVGFVAGMVITTLAGAAAGIHADPAEADVQNAAAEAGVDVEDLRGAVATTGLDPFLYLRAVGELPPLSARKPPPVALVNSRVECIIHAESGGANVANRHGSGAVGVLQYMPSTFFSHAAEMGHRDWSPWNPDQARAVAAHDLAMGRRGQWTVGGC